MLIVSRDKEPFVFDHLDQMIELQDPSCRTETGNFIHVNMIRIALRVSD